MSRIGKQPVQILDKVKVDIKGTTVSVEGPKGKGVRIVGEHVRRKEGKTVA